MTLLEIRTLSKSFNGQEAVRQVSAKVKSGTKIGLLGQTGAGKTSLLKMIAGLQQPDGGTIRFEKEKVLGPEEKLVAGHNKIAYLSQHFDLPKFLSVEEALNREVEITERDAKRIYKACDIVHLLQKDTRSLSGGEKQRVGLARSLVKYPSMLLLDEPFSNLDFIHKQAIKEVIENILQDWVSTIILTSHDPNDLLPWADELWVMQKGKIRQKGAPEKIYRQPKNRTVAGLTGHFNLILPEKWNLEQDTSYSQSGSEVIIRPEDFRLSEIGPKGVKGIINEVVFQGPIDYLKIQTDEQAIISASESGRFRKGQQVYLSIK